LLEGQLVVERRYNDSLDRLDDNNEDKIKQSYAKIHVIQAQIAAIKDYVAQNYKAGQSDKEVRLGLIESLEKQIKALETAKKKATTIEDIELLNAKLWDLRHELNMLQEAGKNLAQPFDEGVLKGFSKVVEKEMDGTQERINANLAKRAEEWTRIYNANLRKQKDDTKLTIEQIEEIWQEGFNSFTTLVQAVTDYRSANNAAELDDLQAKSEYEQELAGDNVKAREKIEKEFDKKQRKLRQEQAERDRKMALFNIAISTSQGIMSALAQLPPNIPLSILIGITGAAQGALVAAKPARFAKGVYDLEGPGSSTSDSIPALLSAHESVVPADRNKKFGFFLKEIIENPALDLWDVKNMIDEKLPTQYAKIIMNPGTGADSKEMLDELRATRRAIENKPAVRIDVDENGFNVSIQRGNHWTKYANSRYTADV
jgi:hypothetical protein